MPVCKNETYDKSGRSIAGVPDDRERKRTADNAAHQVAGLLNHDQVCAKI
jgi:hypothetical protein